MDNLTYSTLLYSYFTVYTVYKLLPDGLPEVLLMWPVGDVTATRVCRFTSAWAWWLDVLCWRDVSWCNLLWRDVVSWRDERGETSWSRWWCWSFNMPWNNNQDQINGKGSWEFMIRWQFFWWWIVYFDVCCLQFRNNLPDTHIQTEFGYNLYNILSKLLSKIN